ncbi:phage tail assembly chaperone [Aureimonas sp. SK2]|uniref:phage tail assembly chaperone n=1 Tax=Aureimonas sp. SK2 TaxID=3015992 RepID=UPI002443B053|nr:phage tail assembly chaperone [Aureimonas sp. SK2]
MSAAAPDEASSAAAFPWDELFATAVCVLRMTPDAVWRASPRELALALRPFAALSEPPSRARLDELMQRFPDRR